MAPLSVETYKKLPCCIFFIWWWTGPEQIPGVGASFGCWFGQLADQGFPTTHMHLHALKVTVQDTDKLTGTANTWPHSQVWVVFTLLIITSMQKSKYDSFFSLYLIKFVYLIATSKQFRLLSEQLCWVVSGLTFASSIDIVLFIPFFLPA